MRFRPWFVGWLVGDIALEGTYFVRLARNNNELYRIDIGAGIEDDALYEMNSEAGEMRRIGVVTPISGAPGSDTLSDGALTNSADGQVGRHAVSMTDERTSPGTDWQSKLEWRRDSGVDLRTQWVGTHRLTHRLSESWGIVARCNYADTDDELDPATGAARQLHGALLMAARQKCHAGTGFGRYAQRGQSASADAAWLQR